MMKKRKKAEPTIAINLRVNAETHQMRERLQEQLQCPLPELFRRGLEALDASLKEQRSQ